MAKHSGVYARGGWLWVRWTDADGKRQYRNSNYRIGEEGKAAAALEVIRRQVKAQKEVLAHDNGAPSLSTKDLTIEAYWSIRLRRRELNPKTAKAAKANVWHGRDYILPAVGHYRLDEFRPRHALAFAEELKAKRREDGTPALASRTLHTVWSALKGMFRDAVIDELVVANPCVLPKGTLPKKKDRDPKWRRTAFFTVEEVEQLISDPRIPLQRRVLYAILFIAGVRPGEASALRWNDYATAAPWEPLGMLDIQRAYDTDGRQEGETKTEKQRLIPVHPVLCKVLALWRLSGWAAHMGRPPKADDLVVPNQQGTWQSGNGMRNRFMEDVEAIGLRKRRFYDTRRTFITRCQSDLIPKDIYRWWTHGPPDGFDAVDLYASVDWPAHCREMLKLKVSLKEGMFVKMAAGIATNWDSQWDSRGKVIEMTKEKRVGARGFEPAPIVSLPPASPSNLSEPLEPSGPPIPTVLSESGPAVPLSHPDRSGITRQLGSALTGWLGGEDSTALIRRLTSLLRELGGAP